MSKISNLDETQSLLDDHLTQTASFLSGLPYVAPIMADIRGWNAKLAELQEAKEELEAVQKLILELISPFRRSWRHSQQAKHFGEVLDLWELAMRGISATPKVVHVIRKGSEFDVDHLREAHNTLLKLRIWALDQIRVISESSQRLCLLRPDVLLSMLGDLHRMLPLCFEGLVCSFFLQK